MGRLSAATKSILSRLSYEHIRGLGSDLALVPRGSVRRRCTHVWYFGCLRHGGVYHCRRAAPVVSVPTLREKVFREVVVQKPTRETLCALRITQVGRS